MKFRRSIKFNVWARFEAIVIAMLAFTYVFLIVLFPSFYEWMKTYEIAESMAYIKTSWSLGDSDNFGTVVTNIARKNKMYIEVSTPYRIGYVDYLGGSQSLSQLSKTQYQQAALDSDTGVYYDQIRDERENNTVLMMCTYIGTKDDPQAYIFICSYLQPIGTTVAIFQRQFLFVSLNMMMLTLFVSLFFANKITNPIININKHAKDLPQGKFDAVIDDHDFNEIQQLASTLQEASKEIAKSDDLRRELMANISHDLRTPLTSIYGACSTVTENYDSLGKEQALKLLREACEDAQWLNRMVENLLSVTRFDGEQVAVKKTPTVLEELLDAVLVKFKKRCPDVPVQLELPEDFVMIPMDSMLIQQVLMNLLENAVLHAEGMTTLTLRVFTLGSRAVFEVKDDGCGIPKERLRTLFSGTGGPDPNAPADSGKHGMGIGLSVCAAIIKAHGGEIDAESRPGEGTTIRFWLETEKIELEDAEDEQ